MKLNIVPARTGARWVREGVRIFWKQPLAFAGLFFMFLAATVVATMLPLVGDVLALVLVPAATVGLMSATRQVLDGRFPLPVTLLVALRQSPAKTRAMLILGGLYALAVLLIIGLASLLGDGKLPQLLAQEGGRVTPEMMAKPEVREAARAAMRQLMMAGLLYIPVSVLFWHAPALVHWHDVPVGKSLFFSAVGVLRNTGAYLIYGMGWMLLMAIAWMALLMAAAMMNNLNLAVSGMFPVGLAIVTMFYASLWFTFRDSFAPEPPPQAPSP
ncbi:MAG: BPSS1780 family membrane protein [Pseudomonadota bacterium]|nr:BPSS1780 family membrane protein [Pseudomonadota bacterium]